MESAPLIHRSQHYTVHLSRGSSLCFRQRKVFLISLSRFETRTSFYMCSMCSALERWLPWGVCSFKGPNGSSNFHSIPFRKTHASPGRLTVTTHAAGQRGAAWGVHVCANQTCLTTEPMPQSWAICINCYLWACHHLPLWQTVITQYVVFTHSLPGFPLSPIC